jgi:hypothetical protein
MEANSHGVICNIYYQVFRNPSEYVTNWMGKHLLAKPHIAKLNKETSRKLPKSQIHWSITLLWPYRTDTEDEGFQLSVCERCAYLTFRFDLYWLKWQTKHSKLAVKDLQSTEYHRYIWTTYRLVWFVSGQIPWNVIFNLNLCRTYKSSQSQWLVSAATTLSYLCQKKFSITVDVLMK